MGLDEAPRYRHRSFLFCVLLQPTLAWLVGAPPYGRLLFGRWIGVQFDCITSLSVTFARGLNLLMSLSNLTVFGPQRVWFSLNEPLATFCIDLLTEIQFYRSFASR